MHRFLSAECEHSVLDGLLIVYLMVHLMVYLVSTRWSIGLFHLFDGLLGGLLDCIIDGPFDGLSVGLHA